MQLENLDLEQSKNQGGGCGTLRVGRIKQGGIPVIVKDINILGQIQEVNGGHLFLQEVITNSRIIKKHPNLCQMYGIGLNVQNRLEAKDKCSFLCFEYLEGSDLFKFAKQQGVLRGYAEPFEQKAAILDILEQLIDGLTYLHYLGIVHCDLKPQNIMIRSEAYNKNSVKIIDFGISITTGD